MKEDIHKKIKGKRHSQARKVLPISKEASIDCQQRETLTDEGISNVLMVLIVWGTII